jgi:hypothetical protein
MIELHLEDPLAEKLLLSPGKASNWLVSAENDKLVFTEQEKLQEEPKPPLAIPEPQR